MFCGHCIPLAAEVGSFCSQYNNLAGRDFGPADTKLLKKKQSVTFNKTLTPSDTPRGGGSAKSHFCQSHFFQGILQAKTRKGHKNFGARLAFLVLPDPPPRGRGSQKTSQSLSKNPGGCPHTLKRGILWTPLGARGVLRPPFILHFFCAYIKPCPLHWEH